MRPRWIAALLAVALGAGTLTACGSGDGSGSSAAKPIPSAKSKRTAQVWAIGDGADGGDSARQVADMVAAAKPDRLLYLGDVYDDGTSENFARNYRPVYGRFDKITAPTPGNHDWPNHAQGYDPYWKAVGLVTNRHYYSFRAGGWEIVSLNSESGLENGSPQRRWLEQKVRKPGTCRIGFWHRPYLNAGKHGDQKDTAPLWRAMSGRAALVVNGHDHNFQHFKRRNGIVELISGAGGHDPYQSNGRDPRLVWDDDDQHGALRLDLRPGLARFRFVALPGRTVHSGSVRCRR
jgi:3',5'-cyclic AMP phosphodiesterase CpdA